MARTGLAESHCSDGEKSDTARHSLGIARGRAGTRKYKLSLSRKRFYFMEEGATWAISAAAGDRGEYGIRQVRGWRTNLGAAQAEVRVDFASFASRCWVRRGSRLALSPAPRRLTQKRRASEQGPWVTTVQAPAGAGGWGSPCLPKASWGEAKGLCCSHLSAPSCGTSWDWQLGFPQPCQQLRIAQF